MRGLSSIDFFFSSRRRHTISLCDWSSDVCSSDLTSAEALGWLGAEASPAVPSLRRALDDGDGDVRVAASNALYTIDPKALEKADAGKEIGRASCRERG